MTTTVCRCLVSLFHRSPCYRGEVEPGGSDRRHSPGDRGSDLSAPGDHCLEGFTKGTPGLSHPLYKFLRSPLWFRLTYPVGQPFEGPREVSFPVSRFGTTEDRSVWTFDENSGTPMEWSKRDHGSPLPGYYYRPSSFHRYQ